MMQKVSVIDAPDSFVKFLEEFESEADAGVVLIYKGKEYFVELLTDDDED